MSNLLNITLQTADNKQYFIKSLIGSGGMADVYRAWDSTRQEEMAIKVIKQKYLNNHQILDMFRSEANNLTNLNHPKIVRLYEFDQDINRNFYFLVMEYVDGSDLRKLILENKSFSLDEIDNIIFDITTALHYSHHKNIIHCDLKSANIMQNSYGQNKLTDFGISKKHNNAGSGGTLEYMSPEQICGQVSKKTDIFSLAVVTYELISGGFFPYTGQSENATGVNKKEKIQWEQNNIRPKSLKNYRVGLHESVDDVIFKALSLNPDDRYKSVLEFHKDLRIAINNSSRKASQGIKTKLRTNPNPPSNIPPKTSNKIEHNKISSQKNNWQIVSNKHSKPKNNILNTIHNMFNTPISNNKPFFYLYGLQGEYENKKIQITSYQYLIGREKKGNNLVIDQDNYLSRSHAKIWYTNKGFFIEDRGSSGGTYVNGQKIYDPKKLNNNDVIEMGNQTFRFIINK